MKKLSVLLLGWEFPPKINGEVGIACYGVTKALANQVNLSLILPKTDPEFILKNVELTGLNNVNLRTIETPAPDPEFSAFAKTTLSHQNDIPLYGAATTTFQEEEQVKPAVLPGQTTTVGTFASEGDHTQVIQSVEELNIFGQTDLSLVDYNSQVIHFARYASRLASQKVYDVIYAYDWMTFLAGIELKLVSGKPLVLHMHSLSLERGGPDAKGWVYGLEKQALEKSDFIIADSDKIANIIIAEYGILPAKIKSLQAEKELDNVFATEEETTIHEQPAAEEIADEIYNMEVSESNNDVVKTLLPVTEDYLKNSEQKWEATAVIILDVLEQVQANVEALTEYK